MIPPFRAAKAPPCWGFGWISRALVPAPRKKKGTNDPGQASHARVAFGLWSNLTKIRDHRAGAVSRAKNGTGHEQNETDDETDFRRHSGSHRARADWLLHALALGLLGRAWERKT